MARDRYLSEGEAAELQAGGNLGALVQKALGLLLLLGLAIACAIILRPFVLAVIWGTILVVSTWSLYARLARRLRGRRTLATAVMTGLLAIVLVLPLVLLGMELADSAVTLVANVRAATEHGLPPLPPMLADLPLVGKPLAGFWHAASQGTEALLAALEKQFGSVPALVRDWVLVIGGAVGEGLLQVLLSLLAAFVFYRDGPAMLGKLETALARVAGARARSFGRSAAATIKAVVLGLLGTCFIQAVLAGAGYWLAGVPGSMFLGFLAFFLSLIPAGMAVIWLPAALWLISQGQTEWAVFVVGLNIFLGALESFLRPYLMRQGVDLPLLLLIVGVVGGAIGFGFVGVFIGPVLLGIAASLVQEWTGPVREAETVVPGAAGMVGVTDLQPR